VTHENLCAEKFPVFLAPHRLFSYLADILKSLSV
jgi:hypothetical protein